MPESAARIKPHRPRVRVYVRAPRANVLYGVRLREQPRVRALNHSLYPSLEPIHTRASHVHAHGKLDVVDVRCHRSPTPRVHLLFPAAN